MGNNVPFYIGKTINPQSRKYNHRRKFEGKILLEVIDEIPISEWRFWEKYYISLFKGWGFILENSNNGKVSNLYQVIEYLISESLSY
jgi:hypothetical protein